MTEWKAILGYEGLYEVSDEGQVRRVGSGAGAKVGRVLKPQAKARGHLQVGLKKNGKTTWHKLHRLVAHAFLPAPENSTLFVCHRDGDPSNNTPTNLYFGSHRENMDDMIRHGRSGLGGSKVRLTQEQVDEIRRLKASGRTLQEIADLFYIKAETASKICRGVHWKSRTVFSEIRPHVETWAGTYLRKSSSARVAKKEVYAAFVAWCQGHGYASHTQQIFGRVLMELYPTVKNDHVRISVKNEMGESTRVEGYKGIALVSRQEDEE